MNSTKSVLGETQLFFTTIPWLLLQEQSMNQLFGYSIQFDLSKYLNLSLDFGSLTKWSKTRYNDQHAQNECAKNNRKK